MKVNHFLKEFSNLLFFWFLGIVFFFLFRLSFVLIFSKQLGANVEFTDYLNTFLMGFKFDCTVMGYFLLLPYLLLLSLSYFGKFKVIKVTRRVHQVLFLFLSAFICVITLNFYYEYNEQFNNFVFLAFYDDQAAIAQTIMDYYHPWLNLLAITVIIVGGVLLFRFFEKRTFIFNILKKIKPKWGKALLITLSLLLFICNIRGTVIGSPAIRKWAGVAKDPFLNKVVINPYRSLKYAYADFKELNYHGENPFGEEDLQEVFQEESVLQVIGKTAKGSQMEKPKQIFLVIMESYDSWPLMNKYLSFNLSESLKDISEEGAFFPNFLPAYSATIHAYNTIVTGIPYCGVHINYLGAVHDPYETSIFKQFKKLGYTTNFFYGGYLSWENIGEFTDYQGCDHIYSGMDAGDASDFGRWGIEDEKLFDLVLNTIDPEEYTFNVILTSSYHSPYEVDVYAKGFPYKSPDEFSTEAQRYYDSGMTMKQLGHLWYGDREIGRFMKEAKEKYENGLYGFTGDHYGRRFVNHSPNLYEKSSVPFVLYGNGVPIGKKKTPGDHSDIIPTLIELVAPEGFTYYSFGRSMLEDKSYGMGFEKIIDQDSLFHFAKDALVDKFSIEDEMLNRDSRNRYGEEYRRRQMLAWHYIVRGNCLIEEK